MIKNKILLILCLSVLFSSCMGIKKFKTEDLNIKNTLRDTTIIVKDSVVNFTWKDIFVDTTLQSLIQEGIDNNTNMIMAYETVIQSQEYLKQSKWAYAPSVGAVFSSAYNYNQVPDKSAFMGVNLSWEPDIWGKTTANKRAYQSGLLKDIASIRSIQSEVVAAISTSYYQLLALDEQLSLTREFILISENTLKTIKVMHDNGMSNSAAVEQTKAQYYSALASIPALKNSIYSVESALSVLIGRSAGSIVRVKPTQNLYHSILSEGLPFYLVSNRPDVKIAEFSLVQMFNIAESSKVAMYPSIRIGFDTGAAGASLYNFVSPSSLIMNFLGGITAPIFNGRALRTQFNVNTSKKNQAVEKFEYTLRLAGSEVSEAMYAYDKLNEIVELRVKEVASSSKAVDYTNELLYNGKVTYLEVLSAQSSYLTSSMQLIEDKLDKERTFIRLYKALGGGWL